MPKRLLPALLVLALAGCNLPRGAAMQGEILRGAQSEQRDFQVVAVTRDTVEALSAWPLPPQAHLSHAAWPQGGLRSPDSAAIAAGDKVAITIWDNEENSLLTTATQKSAQLTEAPVAGDGTIFVPYVGKVAVRGLSPDQAREKVQEALAGALPSAQVQVAVTPGRQNTVDLVGGVAKAGSYPIPDRSFSVLSLLSQGGGVTPSLQNPIVKLVRGGRAYGISVERLFAQPALDVSLRGGDKVIVEDDPRQFLALGATGKQSTIPFSQDSISALEAVSLIGGVNATRANPKGVLILREYAKQQVRSDGRGPDRARVVFTVDLTSADGLFSARNFQIASGDLVLATESPVTSTRTVFGLIGQIFGLANQVDGS
ncbi:MAG: polysaccharide biosynthesis/export family protein [Gemmobacter sp.]|uniref:polysaccharide biosynthesis/export family protein n=1 Tax=Gemmobacter sp. TaxID=1898957 RepID=UPI00391B4FB4